MTTLTLGEAFAATKRERSLVHLLYLLMHLDIVTRKKLAKVCRWEASPYLERIDKHGR
jgi:hypothetical protein